MWPTVVYNILLYGGYSRISFIKKVNITNVITIYSKEYLALDCEKITPQSLISLFSHLIYLPFMKIGFSK